MRVFGFQISLNEQYQDALAKVGPKASSIYAKKIDERSTVRVAKTTLDYEKSIGRSDFLTPEWDFATIGRYATAESYFARSVRIKADLMLKQGWDLVGKDKRTLDYIKYRFKQLGFSASLPMEMLIHQTITDLIQYSNAFWVRERRPAELIPGTRERIVPTKKNPLEPTAAFFHLPPEMVSFRKTAKKVVEYRQDLPDGTYRVWSAEDVVHFYFDRKGGLICGMPQIIPVMEDIKLLRTLEENIALLVHKNLFPLFHIKVGSKEEPAGTNYETGELEVKEVRDMIQTMPSEGLLVTDHRQEINAVGSESKALRIEGYLQHFKTRTLGGLGISGIDVGETATANKATSEVVSKQLIDGVKSYQRVFEWFMNFFVIKELLLEADFAKEIPILSDDFQVLFKFPEVDIESKIKWENHAIQKWLNNGSSFDEFRIELGYDPGDEELFNNTYAGLITFPLAKMQVDSKLQIASMKPINGGENASAQKARPSNQHGTKTGPKKYKSSEDIEDFEFDKESFIFNCLDKLKEMQPVDFIDNNGSVAIIYSECMLYADALEQKINELANNNISNLSFQLIVDSAEQAFLLSQLGKEQNG